MIDRFRFPSSQLLAVITVAVAASVLSAQPSLPKAVVRDSAKIRIVEYPTLGPMLPLQFIFNNPNEPQLAQLPPAFRIDAKPYLDIGGLNEKESEELDARNPALAAVEMSNGNLIVNDMKRLMVYSSSGKFLHSAGRVGNGPGEFGQAIWMCHINNDRVLVSDLIGGRISEWNNQGAHIATHARPGNVVYDGCLNDGSLIVAGDKAATVVNEDRFLEHFMSGVDSKVIKSLGQLPAYTSSGAVFHIPIIVAHDDLLYVANGRTYEIRVQDFDGHVRRIIRLSKPPEPITDKQWREAAEATVPTNVSAAERAERVGQLTARPKPTFFSPYLVARVDPSNRIWVSDAGSQRGWTVFDSDGLLMGRVSFPIIPGKRPNRLANVFSDHIQVHEVDDDGAIHLRFYHITPLAQARK